MNINLIEKMLNEINFDKDYIEATFQYKLLMKLAKIFDEDMIFPERNINFYKDLKLKNKEEKFLKKEIDVLIKCDDNRDIAIELKMPMNGQVPEQMYSFVKDIRFLEQLKETGQFSKCFFIIVTNDKNFWQGATTPNDIYSFFRKNKKNEMPTLNGTIKKPTGKDKDIEFCTLSGDYKIEWKSIENKIDFQYFIIEIM
jgi:hypothetical protein